MTQPDPAQGADRRRPKPPSGSFKVPGWTLSLADAGGPEHPAAPILDEIVKTAIAAVSADGGFAWAGMEPVERRLRELDALLLANVTSRLLRATKATVVLGRDGTAPVPHPIHVALTLALGLCYEVAEEAGIELGVSAMVGAGPPEGS
jgi:hypothetical protein